MLFSDEHWSFGHFPELFLSVHQGKSQWRSGRVDDGKQKTLTRTISGYIRHIWMTNSGKYLDAILLNIFQSSCLKTALVPSVILCFFFFFQIHFLPVLSKVQVTAELQPSWKREPSEYEHGAGSQSHSQHSPPWPGALACGPSLQTLGCSAAHSPVHSRSRAVRKSWSDDQPRPSQPDGNTE